MQRIPSVTMGDQNPDTISGQFEHVGDPFFLEQRVVIACNEFVGWLMEPRGQLRVGTPDRRERLSSTTEASPLPCLIEITGDHDGVGATFEQIQKAPKARAIVPEPFGAISNAKVKIADDDHSQRTAPKKIETHCKEWYALSVVRISRRGLAADAILI